jgi:hypothetical protein
LPSCFISLSCDDLQTLVKKGFMRQGTMLGLNQLLMVITTLPVLQVSPISD